MIVRVGSGAHARRYSKGVELETSPFPSDSQILMRRTND
jgi:hypothetical protein